MTPSRIATIPDSSLAGRATTIATACFVCVAVVAGGAFQRALPEPSGVEAAGALPPELPEFAGTLINFDRRGARVAACARAPDEAERRVGARTIAPTHVWVLEGDIVRQLGITTGACDPAWSPDGQRLVVVQPNGLWTYSPTLDDPRQLAETHLPAKPQHESDYTAFQAPLWSHDSRYVAYRVTNGATSWVEVVDSSNGKRMLRSEAGAQHYRWEPDRATLVVDGRSTALP